MRFLCRPAPDPRRIALSSFTLGETLPLLVSCGQEMLPQGQHVASGLTMGVT